MKKETILSFEENGVMNIEMVIETYSSYIYKILKNSISKEQDIEEILSDVFMVFWKKYNKIDIVLGPILKDNVEYKKYIIDKYRNILNNISKKKILLKLKYRIIILMLKLV